MNKISVLLQTVYMYNLLYMHTVYTQHILHKHIHECVQSITLWRLAKNIFLPLFENFAYLKQTYLIRQLKNIKDTTLEDNATKREQNMYTVNLQGTWAVQSD